MPLLRPTNADYLAFLKAAASNPAPGSKAVVKSRASFNVTPQLGAGALVTASYVGNKSSPSSSVLQFGDPVGIPPVVIIPKVLPTGGDLITLSNGRRYHYFTSATGTYNAGSGYSPVEIMAIGGGGGAQDGGTGSTNGGGGGSGNMIIASFTGLSGTYPVSIGSGGTALNNGANTTFNSTYIIALGGGAGASTSPAAVGGSGGGGSASASDAAGAAFGTVSNGSIISNLANSGTLSKAGVGGGGGGVGAAAPGVDLVHYTTPGGAGVLYAGTYYGGGGGGGGGSGSFSSGDAGGVGGGGNGGIVGGTNTPGGPNTGGGGGGGSFSGSGSGAGGSGILIVSYPYP